MSLTETPPAAPATTPAGARPARRVLRPPVVVDEVATVKSFGLIAVVGFGLLGALLYWRGHYTIMSVMFGLGAVIGPACYLAPAGMVPFHRAWMRLAHFLGIINTAIILTIFYALITLFGLVMRLIGRDALALTLDRAAPSYWHPKARPQGAKSYFRQF